MVPDISQISHECQPVCIEVLGRAAQDSGQQEDTVKMGRGLALGLRTSCVVSALVLLCACGGERTSAPPTPSGPLLQGLNVAGNWQFSTTSLTGAPAATIAGSLAQSGSSLSGAVHVGGSNCFDQLTTIGLTGTLTSSNVSLTSTSVDGQVTTLTGSITENAFTGTYAISGGCADGDHGNVTGIKLPSFTGTWSGTFRTEEQIGFDVTLNLTQGSPSSEGSFGLTGTATFSGFCAESGTIMSGTFPFDSFIIGAFVSLEIVTSNGTLAFVGTRYEAGRINGDYRLSGGTCDHTGTGTLEQSSGAGNWDY